MKPLAKDLAENGESSKHDEEPKVAKKLDLSKVKVEPLFEDYVDFEKFSESDFRVVKVKACEEVPKSKKLLKFTLDDGSGKDRTILKELRILPKIGSDLLEEPVSCLLRPMEGDLTYC